jgi:hypothetical protein
MPERHVRHLIDRRLLPTFKLAGSPLNYARKSRLDEYLASCEAAGHENAAGHGLPTASSSLAPARIAQERRQPEPEPVPAVPLRRRRRGAS